MSKVRFLGLDVHANTIAVAVAEPNGEVRPIGTIPNRLEVIRKLVQKLGPVQNLRGLRRSRPDRLCALLATDSDRGDL
jgi:transposase